MVLTIFSQLIFLSIHRGYKLQRFSWLGLGFVLAALTYRESLRDIEACLRHGQRQGY